MLATGLLHGILIGSVYGLLTLGFAIVRSVSGILNFAHGHLVVLAMYVAIAIQSAWGLDPYVGVVVVVPVMFVLGVVLYAVVFRRLATSHILIAVQATLGLAFVIEGALTLTQGGQEKRAASVVDGRTVQLAGIRVEVSELIAFAVSAAAALVLFFMLSRTPYGRNIRAVHQNPHGAVLMGVNVPRVQMVTFGLGLALAGLAGVLLLPGASVHPSNGLLLTVTAILALFIGGQDNLLGALGGGLVLGLSESLGALYLPGAYGFILPYAAVVVILLLRPNGIFAKAGAA